MMWPPQSVKMVSTPSFLSALATRWPPEITLASRLLRCRVSSAVVALTGLGVGFTVAMLSPSSGCWMLGAALREMLDPHGLQHEERHQRCDHVEGHENRKHRGPAVRLCDDRGNGNQQGARALGG